MSKLLEDKAPCAHQLAILLPLIGLLDSGVRDPSSLARALNIEEDDARAHLQLARWLRWTRGQPPKLTSLGAVFARAQKTVEKREGGAGVEGRVRADGFRVRKPRPTRKMVDFSWISRVRRRRGELPSGLLRRRWAARFWRGFEDRIDVEHARKHGGVEVGVVQGGYGGGQGLVQGLGLAPGKRRPALRQFSAHPGPEAVTV
jgi:hypothetical protein